TFGETDNGNLYVWGLNNNGQLGLGDNYSRLTPQLVPKLNGIKWKSILQEVEKKYKQGRNLSHLINDSITSDLKISIGSNDLLVHKAIIIPQCSQLVSLSLSSELPSQLTFEILSYLVKILYGS